MRIEFEKKIAREAKTNPKQFWRYANSKSRTRIGVADLYKDPGDPKSELTKNDKEKAEVLSDFLPVCLQEKMRVKSLL